MKFEGSSLEKKYDKFWDNVVVSIDRKISSVSQAITFFPLLNLANQINRYAAAVQTLIRNMLRQCQSKGFEDEAYIIDYINQAAGEAIQDLRKFELMMKNRGLSSNQVEQYIVAIKLLQLNVPVQILIPTIDSY